MTTAGIETGPNGHSALSSGIGQRHTVSFGPHSDPVEDGLMHDRRVRNDTGSSNETGLAKSDWELKTFSVACLIINKMIGTGIFITPSLVVKLVGSKSGALGLWIAGAFYSYLSIFIYLEYGRAWPFDGGEFVYIGKVFPLPPIVWSTAFGWFFCMFSTSFGSSINAGRYFTAAASSDPANPVSDWLIKYVGLAIVAGISIVHYRLVNIGLWANNILACLKMMFLFILILATTGKLAEYGGDDPQPGKADYASTTNTSPTNVVLAVFLVLYSYQGWENANYITATILGDEAQRKKRLRDGALLAISLVSLLYIFFNAVAFLLFNTDDIVKSSAREIDFGGELMVKIFEHKSDRIPVLKATYTCMGLFACGNLVGVIFTNSRVKREIARAGVIPFSNVWMKSSKYGLRSDGYGTPTGGLILHFLATWLLVTAVPLSPENYSFIINVYTYGHTILGIFLGYGLFRDLIQKRIEATSEIDRRLNAELREEDLTFRYFLLRSKWIRWTAGLLFISVNTLLVVIPLIGTNNPDGTPRRIPSWALVVTVVLAYTCGVMAGFGILLFAPRIIYFSSHFREGCENPVHIDRRDRYWSIEYPKRWHFWETWNKRSKTRWTTFKARLNLDGEANAVENYNDHPGLEMAHVETNFNGHSPSPGQGEFGSPDAGPSNLPSTNLPTIRISDGVAQAH